MDYEIKILNDRQRLKEIFELRCLAWENNDEVKTINFNKYPEGYSDSLDDESIHFVCIDPKKKIIGAARLTILQSFENIIYPKIFSAYNEWPLERPFLLYSRQVVHPSFQGNGIGNKLDWTRIAFQYDNDIKFGTGTANQNRLESLVKKGWKTILKISNEMDSTYDFSGKNYLLILLNKRNSTRHNN
ncbi:hypothetical protein OKW21_004493 [Catalinimonas alkaloidigena]|uniref:GNAT family N-acetyltransferase n=1 Tax=Catalinimonas alkaloidigena TaxID=1075417 RepID=UPI0024057184|nr:GNAT family N-acetyltransferase [Catalinimonas alkaloidigena]MDF9799230.1 hypothetical protein [Catalinimonas alkaloidigena]